MFNFTHYKITQAAIGGYIIRPRTDWKMFLELEETDNDTIIDAGTYLILNVTVDIYEDRIIFMGENGFSMQTTGSEGTTLILQNLRTEPNETN